MRAATLDQRIAGTSYGWEGARGYSASVQRVNGGVYRSNRAINPGCLGGFVYPDHLQWNSSDAVAFSVTEAAWSSSGFACEMGSSTDFGLDATLFVAQIAILGDPLRGLGEGVWTLSKIFRPLSSTVEIGDGALSGDDPGATLLSQGVEAWTGDLLRAWATIEITDPTRLTPSNARIDQRIFCLAGDRLQSSMVDIYRGPYQPDRAYFDGDTAVNAATINGVTPPRRSDTHSHLRSARLDPSQWRWAA